MKTTAPLVALTLLSVLGLVGPSAYGGSASPGIEKIDRDGLTPEAWLKAMMGEMGGAASSPDAQWSAFTLPAGHVIVGKVVDGAWTLDVVPEDAVPQPPATKASGIEPGHDCLNDVVDYWYASAYPLTANLLFPLAPNVASAGWCDGAVGLAYGPVNYMTFSVNGDAGGWIQLVDLPTYSYFEVGCAPFWWGGDAAGAGAGAGFEQAWRTTFEASESICYVATTGLQPSEFSSAYGQIVNWNYYYGSAYGSYLTSGVVTDVV